MAVLVHLAHCCSVASFVAVVIGFVASCMQQVLSFYVLSFRFVVVIAALTHETPDFITPALWSANSPDLKPVDCQL